MYTGSHEADHEKYRLAINKGTISAIDARTMAKSSVNGDSMPRILRLPYGLFNKFENIETFFCNYLPWHLGLYYTSKKAYSNK